ncbi:unnamed protein product [Nesidiocoris tenuis]|uniref:Rapamycin-insensitive companion of mTOR middle domain-containing protein n=1 Tax=Nesidiocoris tenuis TaxID=355587 RepID=A0A6H5FWQ5_9HEMI|nr:unnamed protein product [Nesidiocoris tenuis]
MRVHHSGVRPVRKNATWIRQEIHKSYDTRWSGSHFRSYTSPGRCDELQEALKNLLQAVAFQLQDLKLAHSAHDSHLSPTNIANSLCQDYFLMIGYLTSSEKGQKVLQAANIYEQSILKKIFESKTVSCRMYATKALHAMLRIGVGHDKSLTTFLIGLIVDQLSDEDRYVAAVALNALQEASYCKNDKSPLFDLPEEEEGEESFWALPAAEALRDSRRNVLKELEQSDTFPLEFILKSTKKRPSLRSSRIKQAHEDLFSDVCVFSDVCHILSTCQVRIDSRTFIHEMFDSPFPEVWEDAVAALNRKLADPQQPAAAPSPTATDATPIITTVTNGAV